MEAEQFRSQLLPYIEHFRQNIADNKGDWVVKGFIDIYHNIYTISVDTKVVSKIVELMLFPIVAQFAKDHHYQIVLSEHQNHYPDVSLILPDNTKIALDFKSTYRLTPTQISGFTLGAFTGYFRQRQSTKNVTFSYEDYAAHFVLGTIYTRVDSLIDERRVYKLDDLRQIASVVKDFAFLLHEKWRIASDTPSSGNTKNIGSVRSIHTLMNGNGPFAAQGQNIFDDYWMNYLTPDMARSIDSIMPFHNLAEYWRWRNR